MMIENHIIESREILILSLFRMLEKQLIQSLGNDSLREKVQKIITFDWEKIMVANISEEIQLALMCSLHEIQFELQKNDPTSYSKIEAKCDQVLSIANGVIHFNSDLVEELNDIQQKIAILGKDIERVSLIFSPWYKLRSFVLKFR